MYVCIHSVTCLKDHIAYKDHLSIETTVDWLIVHFSCTKAPLYKDHLRPQLLGPLPGRYRQVLLYVLACVHVCILACMWHKYVHAHTIVCVCVVLCT